MTPRKNGVHNGIEVKLAEIRVRVEERHAENQRRFDDIDRKLDDLLATRSFTKGLWKAVTIAAMIVSTTVSLAIAYIRGH